MNPVRIRFESWNGAEYGEIIGEPMPRTQAINTLHEMYSLSTTGWQYNRQARTIGRDTWTWTLIPA
jgi:hypothetical protein